ncbi:MAG: methyltransferase domain-containing protein [Pyrinomonadaceae bacterium]|nr:methyltransferase domain-containing protein [Pyrinomonadaceae bacterium]
MKLAYFSPFNPQPSGVSDYSEELLPYLAAHADIDLFVDGFQPSNLEMLARFRCFDFGANPASLERLPEYDAIVYHMGNDHRYHTGIVSVMRAHPGVVVFHDFALQDFFLGQAREQGDMRSYLDELEVCHGRRERAKAEEYVRRGATPPQAASPLTFPLNAGLARAAEGIIVHSEWSRERLSVIAPAVPTARINHHITAHAAAGSANHRDDKDSPVRIASFGLITPEKGIERALRALAGLRNEFSFHYTLVGSAGNFPELSQLIQRYNLRDRVTVTGHVSLTEFEERIAETDIAINLRERPVGATSGSLCRIMAAGVPAIVSNVGAFTELPDNAVVKIEHGQYAEPLLEAYLRELMENARLRRQIGKNARRHVRANHTIEKSAASYVDFIREVIERRPRKHFLNDVADELSNLGFRANDEALLRGVAAEVALLAPSVPVATSVLADPLAVNSGNGHSASAPPIPKPAGRLPKIEGLDYKRAAVEYPSLLDAERNYYLRTKPFYNLANKPVKHTGDGMDPETHRHFTDFANMAVALALPAGARILDVGCGSGWLSEYFARLGYEMTGIDISDDLIQMARERVERIPYNVDHETPLKCRFVTHDVEIAPLAEKFDAVICYDSLHHFVDEHAVMRHLSAMVARGGLLFILEGDKPEEGSATEEELVGVMREFATLESPFDPEYLRELIVEHGFKVIGDYVSANGLFERETVEAGQVAIDPDQINYLLCKKVVDGISTAADVPDSRAPGKLAARINVVDSFPTAVIPDTEISVRLRIENTGDTIWLTGPARRKGAVMLGVMLLDEAGSTISERHGEPPLPRALAAGESVETVIRFRAPAVPGKYRLKVDLVAQHVAWFEQQGSEPLVLPLEVKQVV